MISRPAGLRPGQLLPLIPVLVLALALRLFHLGKQALFSDEAWSWAASLLSPGQMLDLSEIDHHVPLFYLLVKLAQAALPATEAGLRTVSVACSILALLTLLAFLALEWSPSAALYAGIFFALSSFDLYYAQETRMYTLLAALWTLAYVALVWALQGKTPWLVVWAVATIAMAWTHMYGLLFAAANAAFVMGYLLWRRVRPQQPEPDGRLLVAALAAVAVGVLPIVRLFLLHRGTSTTAALVPGLDDLSRVFLLWSTGLTSVRESFLDSAHLRLPAMDGIPQGAWLLAGLVVWGLPAIYGMRRAWQRPGSGRVQVALTLTTILLPMAVAFGYSRLTGQALWAPRPFLGAAYLLYLWAGIGLSAVRLRAVRWTVAGLATLIALASIIPYFTAWQKSNAATAFASLPPMDDANALLFEARFFSPLAQFYLDSATTMLAIEAGPAGEPMVTRLVFGQGHAFDRVMGRPYPITCDDLVTVTGLWIYSYSSQVRETLAHLPPCVTDKKLWLFQDGAWHRLNL
jgi:uncharacterized membrane protein